MSATTAPTPGSIEAFKADFINKSSPLFEDYAHAIFNPDGDPAKDGQAVMAKYGYGDLSDEDFFSLWSTTPSELFAPFTRRDSPMSSTDDTSNPVLPATKLTSQPAVLSDLRYFAGVYNVSGSPDDQGRRLMIDPFTGLIKYNGSSAVPTITWNETSSKPQASWTDDSGRAYAVTVKPGVDFATALIHIAFDGTVTEANGLTSQFSGKTIDVVKPDPKPESDVQSTGTKQDLGASKFAKITSSQMSLNFLPPARLLEDQGDDPSDTGSQIMTIINGGLGVIVLGFVAYKGYQKWKASRVAAAQRQATETHHARQLQEAEKRVAQASKKALDDAYANDVNLQRNVNDDMQNEIDGAIQDFIDRLKAQDPTNAAVNGLDRANFNLNVAPWSGLKMEINAIVRKRMNNITEEYCSTAQHDALAQCRETLVLQNFEEGPIFDSGFAKLTSAAVETLGCGASAFPKPWSETYGGNRVFEKLQAQKAANFTQINAANIAAWNTKLAGMQADQAKIKSDQDKLELDLDKETDPVKKQDIQKLIDAKVQEYNDKVEEIKDGTEERATDDASEKKAVDDAEEESEEAEQAGRDARERHFGGE